MVPMATTFPMKSGRRRWHRPSGASSWAYYPVRLSGEVSSSSTSGKTRVCSKSSASLIQVRANLANPSLAFGSPGVRENSSS